MSALTEHHQAMVELARAGGTEAFVALAQKLEPADLADILALLDEEDRFRMVRAMPPRLSGEALVEMPEGSHPEATLAALEPERAAEIVEELEDDDAADLLGELEPEAQERILSEIEDRADVESLLRYDEETAGGRMTTHLVMVREGETASQALDSIRKQAEEIQDFYQVFVVDDQEEVARIMSRYNLPSVPVVDRVGRLLGRVTFDDLVDVVEKETTEDLLQFGGVSADEELEAGWSVAVRSRLPWLYVNLLTAFLAGGVVYLFQGTVQRAVVLAVWMPIIAGMGGNAGTQALAVTVRRLALGLIQPRLFTRVLGKEVLVGLFNGIAVGCAVALVAVTLGEGPLLGGVVFLAMTGNLLVAGFAGAFIPILLERRGVDPAVASSIFVTTFTDVCGFLLLLGLAGWMLF